jgi:hypothetical protein
MFGELLASGAGSTIGCRTTLLMGIDYKKQRRREAEETKDYAARDAYSVVQLTEWVVVVEGVREDGRTIWEVTYDATSSNIRPRMQLARVGRTLVQAYPGPESGLEFAEIGNSTFHVVEAPRSLSKNIPGDHSAWRHS